MKKRLFSAVGLVVVMSISLAHAASSVVHDPRGDSLSPAPYLDVVQAEVVEQQGQATLLFTMQLAGPIPGEPSENVLIWPFHVDTEPDTAPGDLYNEYIVRVRWVKPVGAAVGVFEGHVVNRITGGATAVPFSIDGATVKALVPLELLGNPSSIGWNAATRLSPALPYRDIAPDGCDPSPVPCGLATWTQ